MLSSLELPPKLLSDGELDAVEVREFLSSLAFDTSKIQIRGKGVLFYKGKQVTSSFLKHLVKNYLQTTYPNYHIRKITLRTPPIPISSGYYYVKITPSSSSFSHLYLNLEVFDSTRVVKKVKATIYTQVYKECAIANRKIERGHLITGEELATKKFLIKTSSQECLTPKEVIGAISKTTIYPKKRIKNYMIMPNYPIKKRSKVKIIYQKGAIRIELLGLALDNGNVGDLIRVKNLSSNKVLRCEVLSSSTVRFVY